MKTQSAVMHKLLIIGEAVKRLSTEFRDTHPAIRSQIAGLRDILIHHYDRVDLAELWKTSTSDVRPLIDYLDPLTPKPTSPSGP